jgi:tol-pal system protein YbgF
MGPRPNSASPPADDQTMTRLAFPALFAALGLALAVAAPSFAQTPMDPLDTRDARRLDRMEQVLRELRAIVFQGRDSGKPVVIQPAETDYQLQELTRRLADLEQALTKVNGQLETQAHDLSDARRQVDVLRRDNKDLADRAAALEARIAQPQAAPSPGGPTGPAPAPGDQGAGLAGAPPPAAGSGASEAFNHAHDLLLSGDYAGAEAGFQDYISRFGDGPRGPEAHYWLGKTLSARSAYSEAAGAYIAAIRGWPKTAWAPEAVVELSRSLIQIKKPEDACQTLAELARRYPKAPPAVMNRAAAARAQAKCAA